jgi:hypothetical protein
MFAINFAEIGALDLSFLSCRAYGKFGMTAVMRRALAVLHALIMMSSSISPSLMSPGAVDCRMNTSSSRTDSPIVTEVSWLEYWRTRIFVSSIPSLRPDKGRVSECHTQANCLVTSSQQTTAAWLVVRPISWIFFSLPTITADGGTFFHGALTQQWDYWTYLSATFFASSGWLFPDRSFIELTDISFPHTQKVLFQD